jgi:hypothetical protein
MSLRQSWSVNIAALRVTPHAISDPATRKADHCPQNAARRRTEVNALCFTPDLCMEKPQCFQAGDFRAKFLQTVWKRRRIEDGRAWWGFWLVFAIFCPKLLLTLLALSGPP